jgi:hypothetical protein
LQWPNTCYIVPNTTPQRGIPYGHDVCDVHPGNVRRGFRTAGTLRVFEAVCVT